MILRRPPVIPAIWLATALAVLLRGWIFASVSVTSFGAALVSALVSGLKKSLLWPLLPQPDGPVIGAEAMHRILRGWPAHLGQDAYR